ncbi:hypothetical protein C8R44DRAFT_49770 [Mycena epipterygia]|nr:hypothetical protein C8R44DRAFT_49770 [Mycena epipterygia]
MCLTGKRRRTAARRRSDSWACVYLTGPRGRAAPKRSKRTRIPFPNPIPTRPTPAPTTGTSTRGRGPRASARTCTRRCGARTARCSSPSATCPRSRRSPRPCSSRRIITLPITTRAGVCCCRRAKATAWCRAHRRIRRRIRIIRMRRGGAVRGSHLSTASTGSSASNASTTSTGTGTSNSSAGGGGGGGATQRLRTWWPLGARTQKGWASDARWGCKLRTVQSAGDGWNSPIRPQHPVIPTADARGCCPCSAAK